ncbi:phosphonopyruvate decarboxylase [Mangrovihabitans endophyticus]|uniref:Thiamine pyrophosphate enzyme n=1 Tax=Mangrovihabitans endophyticus TaxID=1751298 RepID=A0A8J3BW40_9ACTN|nr:phosphonopyruvate decarboxylase [Mangrovihabitans endophyticus]GGK72774.1 thiamine pyrophosphate enzyme [Mangrovihabitans endophyticus]
MITAQGMLDTLTDHGHALVTGVPCSYFAGPLRLLDRGVGPRYIPAVNEGSAIAIAAGAQLGAELPVVLAQNSGFGNMINPLTSLVLPYRVPMTVMVSMRGWPTASAGEPQHHWMGRTVPGWLDSLDVSHWMLTADGPSLSDLLGRARPVLDDGQPAFILVAKGAIADDAPAPEAPSDARPTRDEVVTALLAEVGDAHVLSTTGYLSRSLFNHGDRARNFYMQGSMGHVSGIALGAALARPESRFVVLDGDGAVLMHMGVMATVGANAPSNLTHVVFDNGVYDSTGGQRTGCSHTDFASAAIACGYRDARTVETIDALRGALRSALAASGPIAIVVRGAAGGTAGERASNNLPVAEIGARFRDSLAVAAHQPGGRVPA